MGKEKKKYNNVHTELWKAVLKARRKGSYEFEKVKCSRCGSTKDLQYHHPNYDNPFIYEIICSSCHRKEHKAENNFKKAYKKMKRNKFGRFGKEKPIEIIKCLNCGKKTKKQNPKQKYCKKCMMKLNTRHLSKAQLKKLKNGD